MFGLSLSKLILLALLVGIIWYSYRLWGGKPRSQNRQPPPKFGRGSSQETIECPVCKVYVVATKLKNCGQKGCPY